MNEESIQEFSEKEALVKQQVKESRARLENFEVELPKSE
jgi:hypothetical protein